MRIRVTVTIALGLSLTFILAACGTTSREKKQAKEQKTARIGMREICDEINREVQATARQISRGTDDRELKREMVAWQLSTLENCRRALQHPDPRWALLDLWTFLYQSRRFVETTRPKTLLGEQYKDTAAMLDGLLARMDDRAASLLDEKQLEDLREVASEYAEGHPIEGDTMASGSRPSAENDGGGMLSAIASLPMEIFSIGGGVKDTAQAVSEVATAANRGVDIVDSLPLVTRWQVELLLYTIEENESVEQLLSDLDQVSDTIEGVGKTIDTLPERVEQTVARTIREVESTQPEFQKTLGLADGIVSKANTTIDGIGITLDKISENGEWLERTSAHVAAAGKAWEGAIEQINLLANPPGDPDRPEPPPPTEPAPPLDFKDVARTAEYANRTATEVHGAVVELRGLLEGKGIDETLARVSATTLSTLDETSAQASRLIMRATYCAVAVILVFFAALLGYKVAVARVATRGRTA